MYFLVNQSRILFNKMSRSFSCASKINSVKIDNDYLKVVTQNDTQTFPFVWLRDNCQCQRCFHNDSQSRVHHWKDFNIDSKPITISTDDSLVKITWDDNHKSEYKSEWLNERNFSKASQKKFLETVYRPEKTAWNRGNFDEIFKQFSYKDIIADNSCLHEWLKNMCVYGVSLIKDSPNDPDVCKNIAKRVDHIKSTHYGDVFVITVQPGTTSLAYLSNNLQMHTDSPYYEYKPGVNILHCMEQSKGKGGENMLTDGLYVVQLLKENHREAYDILFQTLVDWEDIGQEKGNKFHSVYRSPVIVEDIDGKVVRINHSVPLRSSHFNLEPEKVRNWYRAQKVFVDLIYEHAVHFKMSIGDVLCFDNRRLLHGRSEYSDSSNNVRKIVGVYLDWDYIYSKYRVTRPKIIN